MEATRASATRPDRVQAQLQAQLQALLPMLPVGRVFRTSDGGQTWTRSDLDSLLRAYADLPGRDPS